MGALSRLEQEVTIPDPAALASEEGTTLNVGQFGDRERQLLIHKFFYLIIIFNIMMYC